MIFSHVIKQSILYYVHSLILPKESEIIEYYRKETISMYISAFSMYNGRQALSPQTPHTIRSIFFFWGGGGIV